MFFICMWSLWLLVEITLTWLQIWKGCFFVCFVFWGKTVSVNQFLYEWTSSFVFVFWHVFVFIIMFLFLVFISKRAKLIYLVSLRSMRSERIIINNLNLGALMSLINLKFQYFTTWFFKDLNRILNSSFKAEIWVWWSILYGWCLSFLWSLCKILRIVG